MKNLLVLFCWFNCIQICLGQNTGVLDWVYVTDDRNDILLQGKLLDAISQEPIDSASISIRGNNGRVISLLSDSLGQFHCFLRTDSYKILFEKKQYLKEDEEIEFKNWPDTFKLTKKLFREIDVVKSFKGQTSIDTIIKDSTTAIKIAEAILFSVYGEETIVNERPYSVKFIDGMWHVCGTMPDLTYENPICVYYVQRLGGFSIILNASNGTVLELTHGN